MLKSILYFLASLLVFLLGMLLYGFLLNSGNRSLSEEITRKHLRYLTDIHIIIDRKNYRLDLYSDKVLLKTYRVVFGRNNNTRKSLFDVYATPTGKFRICDIDTLSRYGKFFRLSYPNEECLKTAFSQGEISGEQYEKAIEEYENVGCVELKKLKGREIGIHGIGELNFIFSNLPFIFNWTNGSAAVSNESINEIYQVIKIGTEVEIKN